MRVPVDQPGDEHVSIRVEHVVAGLRDHVGAERLDDAVDGAERDGRAVGQRRVDDREAHASSGTSVSSVAITAARFAALPASNSSTVRFASPTPFARLSTTHTAA